MTPEARAIMDRLVGEALGLVEERFIVDGGAMVRDLKQQGATPEAIAAASVGQIEAQMASWLECRQMLEARLTQLLDDGDES